MQRIHARCAPLRANPATTSSVWACTSANPAAAQSARNSASQYRAKIACISTPSTDPPLACTPSTCRPARSRRDAHDAIPDGSGAPRRGPSPAPTGAPSPGTPRTTATPRHATTTTTAPPTAHHSAGSRTHARAPRPAPPRRSHTPPAPPAPAPPPTTAPPAASTAPATPTTAPPPESNPPPSCHPSSHQGVTRFRRATDPVGRQPAAASSAWSAGCADHARPTMSVCTTILVRLDMHGPLGGVAA